MPYPYHFIITTGKRLESNKLFKQLYSCVFISDFEYSVVYLARRVTTADVTVARH